MEDSKPIDETMATRSICSGSRSSRSSGTSTSSSRAAKARAKAEAARVQFAYAQKEANLLKQQAEMDYEQELKAADCAKKKAELQADLQVLQSEKAAAAALVEAEVLEASAQDENGEQQRQVEHNIISLSPMQRTIEYVQKHAEMNHDQPPVPHTTKSKPVSPSNHQQNIDDDQGRSCSAEASEYSNLEFQDLPSPSHTEIQATTQSITQHTRAVRPKQEHKSREEFYPLQPQYSTHPDTSDVTKYLMRREIVSSGLLKYDDRPENYWVWKTSFHSSTRDLNLSPQEELDLLSKWLGPESAEQAKRIRAAYFHNATAGLNMVWQRLEDCFGAPEVIEHALLKKVEDFPRISAKDNQKLRTLGDLLLELEAAKMNGYLTGLAHLDTARGVNPILAKLPPYLQEKWVNTGSSFKKQHRVSYPPFAVFVKFVCDEAKTRNDPSFSFITSGGEHKTPVSVKRTEVSSEREISQGPASEKKLEDIDKQCPLHNMPHPLRKCRSFRYKSLEERKAFLKDKHICYRCCASTRHLAKDCEIAVQCTECNSNKHPSALHPGPPPWKVERFEPDTDHGEEQPGNENPAVTAKCTEVCGDANRSRSCSKMCLVEVYPAGHREKATRIYAVLDEQSNRSLAKPDFFDLFQIKAGAEPYTLKTCSGVTETSGRRAMNFIIESLDSKVQLPLPTLIECNMIPDDRSEIPSPEIARHYPHLKSVVGKIPDIDPEAPILLLLGRDILRVHKVREQYNGPLDAPYAQRLDLGWVVIGDACLGGAHKPTNISVYRTNVLHNGRASFLNPCTNVFQVKEKPDGSTPYHGHQSPEEAPVQMEKTDDFASSVFQRTHHDDKPATSVEDKVFLKIMDKEVYMDNSNSWVAPLPFRSPRGNLPNNRQQALKRLSSLHRTLERKPDMKEHFTNFMQQMFDAHQAEPAPPLPYHQECWYLPIFGVYHPQKPGQIRVVFDSSAKHAGVSLNDVLLSGPDLNNTLIGVLIRFRKEPIAVTADVKQMFYCFTVREDHRDFLRFLWHEKNNLDNPVVEYRMTVHVFGNSPSPAVAIYCLRRAALEGEKDYGTDAKTFVMRHFYVDDALASFPSEEEAIDVLRRTREMLSGSNIKLHKIASNSSVVMEAFPLEDRSKEFKDLDLGVDPLPMQRSLGLIWNLEKDSFTFQVSKEEKPFTRRGILSTVNSLYDPLGFVAPITMQGKALVRELSSEQGEWDTPLPEEKKAQWKQWKDSLMELEQLQILRPYIPVSLNSAQHRELCIFSDASILAISAVAYLRTLDMEGHTHVGFVMGKSKLAPRPAHTIPRLELCAAVLAVEMTDLILDEMNIEIHRVTFYTDSKVVLGYINNTSRRFYVYVANRVTRIRKSTYPEQWHYVSTDNNPADHGTRSLPATRLKHTNWFSGPAFLARAGTEDVSQPAPLDLQDPDADSEIRPQVATFSTKTTETQSFSERFERFSSWKSLIRAVARIIQRAQLATSTRAAESESCKVDEHKRAVIQVIKCVQHDVHREELGSLLKGAQVPKVSSLQKLNPIIAEDGLLRIGGRIAAAADLSWEEKHPIIIPKNHHIATLLVRHYHEQVAHQGRHFTEGAVRSAGLWITGGKRLVSHVIRKCITCKRLRGQMEEQRMSDLPADRLSSDPPFTHVGLDVFGPWTIVSRRTRGGQAESKRWAVMFTCLSTRAVHIEVLESMTTSSFINALRRFTAIRGPTRLLRSDRGTNFVGACAELQINVEDPDVKTHLQNHGCTWIFNTPHSSHMGGVWERMIGVARRILDAMFLKVDSTRLSHEVLTTLMAEVMAIMNARPLVPVSSDPEMPVVLTPAMLLTQKMDSVPEPPGEFEPKDLHGKQWKQVQSLANMFWRRWRQEYLVTLQPRRKWQPARPDLKVGDLVLLKEAQVKRNEWPTGLIVKTLPSRDDQVRKVEVRVMRQGTPKVYTRPVSEVVLLLSQEAS